MLGITLIRADQNQSRYFEQGKITIGSSASADLRLEHPSVHPEHAMIQVTEGVAVIQRAHRHASLAINGAAVTGVNVLSDAQRLRLGDIELVVQLDDPDAATKQSFDRNAVMAALKRKQAAADQAPDPKASFTPDAPTTEARAPSGNTAPKRQSPVRQSPQAVPARPADQSGPRQVQRQAPRRTTSSAGSSPQRPASTPGAQINRPAKPRRVESPAPQSQESVADAATNMLGGAELDRIAERVAAERKFPVGQGTRPEKEVENFEELPEITADAFEPYRPIESDEIDPEIVNTQRLAVNELASAFASWTKPKAKPEQPAAKNVLERRPVTPEQVDESEAMTSMVSAQTAFPTGVPARDERAPVELAGVEPSPVDPLQVGQASELNTQELTSQQVASLYMLYKKRKAQKKKDESPVEESPEAAEVAEAPADESDEEFSLQNILLEGPQAFGVKTWEEVAAEAAEFQEPEAHYGENRLVAMMSDDGEANKQRQMILGAIALAVVAFTVILVMTPGPPKVLGEKSDKIEDIDVTGLAHLEHNEKEVRCFTEAECKAMAAEELTVAKKEWEDRDVNYDNRFRAFEHADRARVMLESQGLEPTAVEGLQGVWEDTREELDTIYKGLRVSFYIAMSRKRYEDAFNVIQLTKMFFPSPRAREFRWAEHLRLALKEKGVEAEVNHKRAVRGRWN